MRTTRLRHLTEHNKNHGGETRRSAVILAAHGSRQDPTANAIIRSHAERITRLRIFDEVAVAFHQGTPTFASVLDSVNADDIVVVPVMTSDGYYSNTILPRALQSNPRFTELQPVITRPVGTHPGIIALVRVRVAEMLRRHHLEPGRTSLVLVGHGTERHDRSRQVTIELENKLRRMAICAQTLYAFLDQKPLLDGVHSLVNEPNLLVLPILIGGGYHATRDIPHRLGMIPGKDLSPAEDSSGAGIQLPQVGHVGNRRVICDVAIGVHPEIADIIVRLATPHLIRKPVICGSRNRDA